MTKGFRFVLFEQYRNSLETRSRPHEQAEKMTKTRVRTKRRLRVESLEARRLMAVDLLQLDASSYSPDHVLVQLADTGARSRIGESFAGAQITRQVSSDHWYELELAAGSSVTQVVGSLQSQPGVLAATPDFKITISATPNDPSYSSLWGLENLGGSGVADADIDASQAWDYGTSTSTIVAVIDTGIDYNHVDLASNIWSNAGEVAGNGIDDDRNGYVDDTRGWNFVSGNNNPMDDNGHGTHVAGTIGAVGNNGVGVVGVAWSVKVMALKFLDASGSGMLSDAVSAIDYARTKGAKVINASWGGGGFSSALQSAIQRFQDAGGIFVAAAGNESANNATTPSYPANIPLSSVISVAASTSADGLASFSNYGTNVDIAAPGVSILSTVPGNQYARYSGTSMATPHVAGAMALLWGQNPGLTSTQLIQAVMQNTDSVLVGATQYGRLNVGKAAAALRNQGTTDTSGPQVLASVWNASGSAITSVDITFSEAMSPSTMTPASFQLQGPSGAISLSSVTSQNAARTVWRIAFASQNAAGIYTVSVLNSVADDAGNRLDQNRNGITGEVADRYSATYTIADTRQFSVAGPTTLQDATSTRAGVTTIPLDVTESFSIRDLNVDLSIDHTYVSDLRIRLIGPDGTSVLLLNRRGGSRDNIRVLFDDEATTSIAQATGNLSGTFKPERVLSAFDGKNAQGRWSLEITDAARYDVGAFQKVTLIFATSTTSSSSSSAQGFQNTFSIDAAFASAVEWLQTLQRRLRG